MEIKRVPISEVEVWDKNLMVRATKKKDYERTKRQVQELKIYKPVTVFPENGKYFILDGRLRYFVIKDLRHSEIDISVVRPKTEAEKWKYVVSGNDNSSEWLTDKLAEGLYPHIEEINLEDYRIDVGEPISLKDVIEDYAPNVDGREDELPEIDDSPAITKKGDLFTLGRHRLLCGNATKEDDVKRLMNGQKADMVFTDPPYGIDLDTDYSVMKSKLRFMKDKQLKSGKKYKKIEGDDKEFNPKFIFNYFDYCKEIFLWGANYYHFNLLEGGSWCVWDKRVTENFDRGYGKGWELCWSKKEHSDKIIRIKWFGAFGTEKEFDHKRSHPSQKPTALAEYFIDKYSQKDKLVIDLFLGAGTTLLACEKLNRICVGCEIEPKYVDVCITRFSNFTGIPEKEIRATRQNG